MERGVADGAHRLRYVLALVALTVLQYGSVGPVIQFLMLTFFAANHGGADCEEEPSSGPCRRAASDVAVYVGVAFGVAHGVGWLAALVLGSWSDGMGRRPLLVAKSLFSVLPIASIALHVFAGTTLWIYLLIMPAYEVFDINGVFLGFVSDVIVDPQQRTEAYAMLMLTFIASAGPAVLLGGWLSARSAVMVAIALCMVKVTFVLLLLPETAPASGKRPMSLWLTASAAFEIVRRNSFITRMALVFTLSGLSLVGLGSVAKPYLTGYLGVDRATGTRLAFVGGVSVVLTIVAGLKPLVTHLGEVRSMQLCLVFAALLPLAYCVCSEVWHVFVLSATFTGPMVLQFPIIAALKSNLVNEEEQGLMQGSLAALRVLAEAVAGALFGALYRQATNGGAEKDRTAAFGPFVLAGGLGALALLVACTLPERPPPPQPKSGLGAQPERNAELASGHTQYDSVN